MIINMDETCPNKTNQWVTFGLVLKFYITQAPHIIRFIDKRFKQAGNAAPPILMSSWWMLPYVFAPVIAIINKMIVKLQARDLVIYQQRQLLVLFTNDIRDMSKVRHIKNEEDGVFYDLPIADSECRDNSFVLMVTLREYVDHLNMRAQVHWLAIDTYEKIIVLWTIARFSIGISNGITKVEVECDPANNAAIDLAPSVMPIDLVKMRSLMFISEVIEPRKAQLQVTA
jgi:hypothetical protein